jgi:hypothetical protein
MNAAANFIALFAVAIGGFIIIVALVGLFYDTLHRGRHHNGH